MTKHTPGPWHTFDSETGEHALHGIDVGVGRDASDGPFIAHGNCDLPEAEANAHLIAAAPELLAALREIAAMTAEDFGTFRKRGGTYRGLVGVVAWAAIAKADSK